MKKTRVGSGIEKLQNVPLEEMERGFEKKDVNS